VRPSITFRYRNHRGVTADRTVTVDTVEFIRDPGYGYQPGWFISGWCATKNNRRSFALSHIVMDEESAPKIYRLLDL
jgi:hypothetical protein